MEALEEVKQTLLDVEKAGFKDTLDTLDRLIDIRKKQIEKEQEELKESVKMARVLVVAITVPSILLVSFLLWFVSRGIIRDISSISSKVEELAESMRFKGIEFRRLRNELDRLVDALEHMVRDIGSAVVSIKEVMMSVAKGNLRVRVQESYRGDTEELSQHINSSLTDLQKAMRGVKEGLEVIARSIKVLDKNAERIERENDNLNSSIASIMTSVDETSEAIRQISEETLRARNVSIDMERAIQVGKSKVDVMALGYGQHSEGKSGHKLHNGDDNKHSGADEPPCAQRCYRGCQSR